MQRLQIALAFLLATTAGASQAITPSPVTATLNLPYSTVLPGVPFDMTVTLKNTSNHAASVGLVAHLLVKLPDGTAIAPQKGAVLEPHSFSQPEIVVELSAGESVDRVISWVPFPPEWFYDPRFTGPGSYDLSLELVGPNDAPDNYVGTIRTSSAHLERVVPKGVDEEVWNKLLAASSNHWFDAGFLGIKGGQRLAAEIIQLHPSSGYYPYALLFHNLGAGKEAIDPFLEAAERFRDSPANPYLFKQAAQTAMRVAMAAGMDRRDPHTAVEYYGRARELFTRALQTKSLAVRDEAQEGQRNAAAAQEKVRALK